MVRILLVGVAALLLPIAPGSWGAQTARFTSPGGRYEVEFAELEHRRFTHEESLRDLDSVDHVRYRLTFLRVPQGTVAATAEYADVYGFDVGRGPSPLRVVFGWLRWSPEEDFVILPSEGWASAPGTPERTAIALNEKLGWTRAAFTLDDEIWAGPLLAIGDRHNDCDYSVDAFDGASGEQRALVREPASPLGSEIVEIASREILIRTLLDNCASEARRQSFRPECFAFDLDRREARAVACPPVQRSAGAAPRSAQGQP